MEKQKEPHGVNLDEISNSQLVTLIDEWIKNERNRALVKRRLIDGICFEPLAEEFNLSVRQTKSIVYKSLDKLFRHVNC